MRRCPVDEWLSSRFFEGCNASERVTRRILQAGLKFLSKVRQGKVISQVLRPSTARTRLASEPGLGSVVAPLHGMEEKCTP